MISTAYYDALLQGLDEAVKVKNLIRGVAWTAATLSNGRCGVAMHTAGETIPRMFDTLIGLPISEAGKAILSWNMEEASEAFAAVNAYITILAAVSSARSPKPLTVLTFLVRRLAWWGI